MTSDKFTKELIDFGQFAYGSQMVPEHFERGVDSDGQSGIQGMFQEALAAYGPRHIIQGIDVQSGGIDAVTGTAGYYMWDKQIKEFTGTSGAIAEGEYAFISVDGSLAFETARADVTGVILALSGNGLSNS